MHIWSLGVVALQIYDTNRKYPDGVKVRECQESAQDGLCKITEMGV